MLLSAAICSLVGSAWSDKDLECGVKSAWSARDLDLSVRFNSKILFGALASLALSYRTYEFAKLDSKDDSEDPEDCRYISI